MKPLKYGSLGTDVVALQSNLNTLGYGNFLKTGFYGDKTKQSILSLQKKYNLPQTGVFGSTEASKVALELSALKGKTIYNACLAYLHTDASPNDLAPDEYGCADSVSGVLQKALGKDMGIDYTISTAQLYREFLLSKSWIVVQNPIAGDVLVSPTGYGNGGLSNGHTGIVGFDSKIYSNSSATGTWEQNYTLASWKDRYVGLGGFPMFFFRKI